MRETFYFILIPILTWALFIKYGCLVLLPQSKRQYIVPIEFTDEIVLHNAVFKLLDRNKEGKCQCKYNNGDSFFRN